MSAINQALSELANTKRGKLSEIELAKIKQTERYSLLPWIVGTFAISLGVGGWAVSYQSSNSPDVIVLREQQSDDVLKDAFKTIDSPTQRESIESGTIYGAEENPSFDTSVQPKQTLRTNDGAKMIAVSQPETISDTKTVNQSTSREKLKAIGKAAVDVATDDIETSDVVDKSVISVAKLQSMPQAESLDSTTVAHDMVIKQVELSAEQMSKNAQQRAKKALDRNNLKDALTEYNEALKYTPKDVYVRKTLSALYYGKGDLRRSVDLLQKGIRLDRENEDLRLALAKLLMREQQSAAALTALSFLPEGASTEYLSLRGVLAQKNRQDEMALASYQNLVTLEPESGRWWLGLAIQQERKQDFGQALKSYNEALKGLGLSEQSQKFARDRLAIIKQQGE